MYLHLFNFAQGDSITYTVQRALFIVAAFSIIDLVAVADVETLLGAVVPDRVLNEPRKRSWKAAVELRGVDLLGDGFDDFGAAAWLVAGGAVGVVHRPNGPDHRAGPPVAH
jgi:hypothetical protein